MTTKASFLWFLTVVLSLADTRLATQTAEVLSTPRSSTTPSRLLYSFVTNQAGFDTQLTISNTSQDTLGTVPQAGTCTLSYYGTGPDAGSSQVTPSIAAGTQINFYLSQGGSGVRATVGFQGYIMASCTFPLARGTAKLFDGFGQPGRGLTYAQDAQVITLPLSPAKPQALLFPFLNNQGGFDTGFTISNTSADPFGTSPVPGGCTLYFYGTGVAAGAVFPTPLIPAGSTYLNSTSSVAPGFKGYMLAVCTFDAVAGFAFLSDGYGRPGKGISAGYSPELVTTPRVTALRPLLFPAVSNQNGSGAGLVIANTTADPLGTSPLSGACTLSFYGANAPPSFTTPSIASGSVYATTVSSLAPGFQGYIMATCPFPLARGFANTMAPSLYGGGGGQTPEIVVTPRDSAPGSLLFSDARNINGVDTTFTISNTSEDTLGTAPVSGPCSISYFGDVAGGSAPQLQTSASIPAGSALTFSLSRGNPAQGIAATPGFRGYVIAGCAFPLARGVAAFTGIAPVLTPTSISLSSSANPLTYGQSVTLTATVSPNTGTGTVTFYDGTTLLGTRSLLHGQASLTTVLLTAGAHSLKASYSGDWSYAPGNSIPLTQTVSTRPGSGFQSAVNYPAGSGPSSVAIGDFNGDGKVDAAVANFSSNNVSIFLGNGDGTFRAAVNYGVGFGPATVVIADFDGDGIADLAVGNRSDFTVSILPGNGDGTFKTALNSPVGAPASIVVADFNGDGRPDLAVANRSNYTMSVLLGKGDGTFQPAVNYAAGALPGGLFGGDLPYSVATGDFNGDGIADVAMVTENSFIGNIFGGGYVYLGNGDGTFRPVISFSPGGAPLAIAVGDFNADGKADLAIGNHSFTGNGNITHPGSLNLLLGKGDGTFTNGAPYSLDVEALATGDFNGDGSIDVAVTTYSQNAATLLLNNSDGTLQSSPNYSVGNPNAVATGDFNGDGVTDLAIANLNGSLSILLGAVSPPSVHIDTPASGVTFSGGTVLITGWAIDNTTAVGSTITSVQVKVDGAVVGNAAYGINRPDVCAAYPGRRNCPNVGFSYSLNTAVLTNGTHTVTIVATDSDVPPDSGSASITINVSNTGANLLPSVYIDGPSPGAVAAGLTTIFGWAIENTAVVANAITSVQIKVDGAFVGNATYGIQRADVCAAFPSRLGCPNVGFTYSLNTAALSLGTHVITATATDSVGSATTASVTITVTANQSSPAPPTVVIDDPSAGAPLLGIATVLGWALDNNVPAGTPISSVVVKVDGNVIGNAAYGAARADVCAVYPGRPNCPNVGFTFALDTTRLTPGTHTLTVQATDSDANPESASASVIIQVIAHP